MPDMYLDVDIALAEVPVNIFPLTDDTDFKTRETAVAYNAAGMDLVWNFVTTNGAFTQTAVTPTTAGVYDWTHQGDGMYTIEIPASGGASINNDTEGYGWFTGVATGVLPWRGPIIGFRAVALNDALIDGGDNLDVNVTQFGGTNATATGGRPEVNASHIAGSAVSTSSAQIGVNVVNAGGTAWGSGAITAASIASNAITSAKIATDAIGAAQLATDAVTEITDATKTAHGVVSGTADSGTTTTMVDAALTQADTDYWKGSTIVFTSGTISGQARLITGFTPASDTVTFAPATTQAVGTNTYIIVPAGRVDVELWDGSAVNALSSGRVDVTVGAMQADTITSSALATTAVDEIVDATWDEATSGHSTAGTTGKALTDAGSAGDPWSTALPGAYGTGTAGKIVGDNLNATVSSRLASASITLSGGAVTVGTNNDKTGYSLANGAITAAVVATGAIDADALATDAVTEITDATKTAFGLVTGTADSGTTTTMVDAALTQADTDYWKGSIIVFTSGTISGQARLITGFTPASDTVTFSPATTQAVGTNTYIIIPAGRADIEMWQGTTTGAPATAAALVDAVWDEALSGHTTAGTAGKALSDAGSAGDPWSTALPGAYGAGTAGKIIGDNINATISSRLPTANITLSGGAVTVGTNNDKTGYGLATGAITAAVVATGAIDADALATDAVAEIADGVWDEATSGHTTAGTTGKALTDAGSAGDPWSTALPGAYGAGTAGKIIGDNLNATVGSRATQTSVDTVDDFLDTEIAAIKAKTDSLTFTVAGQVDANIQYVNDTAVTGNGSAGTPWGP